MLNQREENLSTEQKALTINLDDNKYGTVVEIGAGQEVARQFFSAGAAAGTIAKTASAYDMRVSDAIYGKAGRYVSRERVEQMMGHEFDLVVDRLSNVRPKDTTYFTYAATVTARSYNQDNECHGWIGLRLQLRPGEEANDIVMHVRMLDQDNRAQSEALGILGVNLIHGAFMYPHKPKWIIESLLDNLGNDRIEVDLIDFSGPGFRHVENRLMNLHLVRSWLTRAVMFGPDGESVVPGDTLYKKPVMVMRGSFKPPTKVHADMSEAGLQQFLEVQGVTSSNVLSLAEITMAELVSGDQVDDQDFLARVDLLTAMGYNVLLSDYLRFFRLRSWLRQFTHNPIGIILSVLDFNYLFDDNYYSGLEGGILEAMGKLFPDNTHVYVYPAEVNGELKTLDIVEVPDKYQYLLKHLTYNDLLVSSTVFNRDHLHISARQVIREIPRGPGDWETQVPELVRDQIIQRRLFGYPE